MHYNLNTFFNYLTLTVDQKMRTTYICIIFKVTRQGQVSYFGLFEIHVPKMLKSKPRSKL